MPKDPRGALQLDDDENSRLDVVWSRSGKRLIMTVSTQQWTDPRQVELQQHQVRELTDFLAETVELQPPDR